MAQGPVDYTKLAGQFGGAPADVSPDVSTLAAQFGGEKASPAPDFKSGNEKDAAGNATVDPNTAGTFFRHLWAGINPVQIGQLLPFPKALGGSGMDHPLLTALPNALALKKDADQRWAKGDKVGATAKYVESLIPILGPMMSTWGDELQSGKYAAAAGDMTGFAGAMATPMAVDAAAPVVRRAAGAVAEAPGKLARAVAPKITLNPAEEAANQFAMDRGIPLDAATATGSRTLRAVQKVVGNTLAGEGTATKMIDEQRAGLSRVGDDLAGEANAGGAAVMPEGAGEGVVNSIKNVITQLHDRANKFYGELRKAEGQHVDQVPKPEDPALVKGRQAREQASIGYSPSETVRQHLRGMVAELESVQYADGKLIQKDLNDSGTEYLHREANAPVYHDILDETPGSENTKPTNADMRRGIESALETGNYTNAAKGALAVAEKRARGKVGGMQSRPMFNPADFATPNVDMGLAVDVRAAKTALRPIFERMKREGELAPLMGERANALRALDRIVNGPDHAPLSIVDGALGDLKAMARGGKNGPALPELRSSGQGTAAYAVQQLERLVRERAAAAGPDVLNALEEGRSATKAKAEVGDLFEQLRQEPVKVFRQLTEPKDAQIKFLRRVREVAPDMMPEIARAWFEQQLELARREGGFGHADKLWADWNALGGETKRVLFPSPGQTQALDHFFLLAKRIAENPNPSGTAHTIGAAMNVGAAVALASHPLGALSSVVAPWAISKILYTRGGVSALEGWMRTNAPAAAATRGAGPAVAAASPAARAAAWATLRGAAQKAGVNLPAAAPMAADSDEQR